MELKVDIGFDQLLQVIKQLPADKISQLKTELSTTYTINSKKTKDNFLELLLNGPVMDDEQYKKFLLERNHFNEWRTK